MKNNKGFTLLEMLVVIAIIAALGVTAGLSADVSMKKSEKNEYKDTLQELFNAASVYVELSSFSCNLNTDAGCDVSIQSLILKGLIDKNILDKYNPIYGKDVKYTSSTNLNVKKKYGIKTVQLKCDVSSASDNDCNKSQCLVTLNGLVNDSGELKDETSLKKYHKNDYWGKC